MIQPESYDDSNEGRELLIQWLKEDLDDQIDKGVIKEELVLNIGKEGARVVINFDFTFSEILLHQAIRSRLSNPECEYIYTTNCNNVDFIESANFQSVTFTRDAYFRNAKFKNNAIFSEATFGEEADFSSATFDKGINLTLAKFTKKADFGKAIFKNNANFIQAEFTDEANFCIVDFQHKADFSKANFTNNAYFSSAIFQKDIDFSEANFTNNAYFVEAKFIVNANFSEAFFTNVEFHKARFAGNTDFSSACFTEKADFRQVNFKKIICLKLNSQKVNFKKANFRKIDIQKVDYINTTFKSDADFSNATFTEEANFYMTKFNTCKFSRTTFTGLANFKSATFEKEAYFGLSREEYDLSPKPKPRTTFEQEANFKRAVFKDEADFKYVIFEEKANFDFTVFKKEVDFKFSFFNYEKKNENDTDSNINSNSFFYTSFEERGAFYDITLLGNLYFDKIRMDDKTNIYFGKTNCKNKNPQRSKIIITNTIINGRIDLEDANVEKINFKNSRVVGSGSVTNTFDNLVDKFDNWETASLFKSEEIKGVNTIKALEYKAAEKNEYKKFIKNRRKKIKPEINELKKEIKKNKVIKAFEYEEIRKEEYKKYSSNKRKKTRSELKMLKKYLNNYLKIQKKKLKKEKNTYWWESLSIRLSRLSNNHGQHWGQAVLFTIISGFICFTIFYAPNPIIQKFGNPELHTTWSGYLPSLAEYYIPINYEVLIEYLADSQLPLLIKICGLLVYFLGKIAVAYGMVEIVQAFRKLK